MASASKGKKKGKRGGKRVRNMVFASGFFSWNQLVMFYLFLFLCFMSVVCTQRNDWSDEEEEEDEPVVSSEDEFYDEDA